MIFSWFLSQITSSNIIIEFFSASLGGITLSDEEKAAMKRVFAKDSSMGERTTALAVAGAMKAKRSLTKVGKGISKRGLKNNNKQITLTKLVQNAKSAIKESKPETVKSAVQVAMAAVKLAKKGKQIKGSRTIKIPTHSGGVLPLIPISLV